MKICIINGPNLNLLGTREPSVYGKSSFEIYLEELKSNFPEVEFSYFQSNVEGELINKLHEIEVHISNTHSRESFRHNSYLAPVAKGIIIGFGMDSYRLGVQSFLK